MSSPNPDRTGAARDTGAVRDNKRKRGLLPLFLLFGLLALIALALILYFSLRGGTKKTATVAPVVPVATTAAPLETGNPLDTSTPGGAATGAASPAGIASPASPAGTAPTGGPAAVPTPENTNPAATGAATPPAAAVALDGGLVGGGAVTPVKATGTLAAGDTAGTVLFAENSSALTENARAVISNAAKAVKADRPAKIYVSGYTDEIAGQPTNLKLSGERAQAVEAALKADVGPGPTAYATRDHGEDDPVASNATAAGRQQNRRATITTD